MRKSIWLWLAIAAVCTFWLAGCGKESAEKTATPQETQQTQSTQTGKGTIKLGYVNWAEGVAVTHLLTQLLQDMGYTVEATMADVAPIFTSVAEGKQDILVETWLPVTHAAYFAQYGDRLELVGTWFENARVGLVVPTYVDIDNIEQLNENRDKFKGVLTGIDSGAGIMGATEKAIAEYNLNYELLASSGPAMTAALKSAIDKQEWIAVTGWAPHWKFARYELKFLDDPKGVYGASEKVKAAARKGFSNDYPEVAGLLGKMHFNGSQIGSLMDAMESAGSDENAAVRKWMDQNRELIQSWLP